VELKKLGFKIWYLVDRIFGNFEQWMDLKRGGEH
jgi:hypothetical protein